MYFCNNCKTEFDWPIKVYEKHTLSGPPYESRYVCPPCRSTDHQKLYSEYCHCCGAKLKVKGMDYCCDKCKRKGEKLWRTQTARKKLICDSALYQKVREAEEYNRKHGANLSYGQYVALTKMKGR